MQKITLKEIKDSFIQNKYKIFYSSLGYCLFIFDSDYYNGLIAVISEIDKLPFWFSYVLLVIVSYFVTKYGLKMFKSLKESKSFSSFFALSSLGSLFGFFTTLVVSFMQVSFLKF